MDVIDWSAPLAERLHQIAVLTAVFAVLFGFSGVYAGIRCWLDDRASSLVRRGNRGGAGEDERRG